MSPGMAVGRRTRRPYRSAWADRDGHASWYSGRHRTQRDESCGTPRLGRSAGRSIDQAKSLAILNAARRLLFRDGLRAFTVEAVAHAAGVSKVTVYSRHGSREALLQAVIAQLARELSMAFDQHPGDSAALRASLIEFGRRLLKFIVSLAHVGLMRSLLGSGVGWVNVGSARTSLQVGSGADHAVRDQFDVRAGRAHRYRHGSGNRSAQGGPRQDLTLYGLQTINTRASFLRAGQPLDSIALDK